MFFCFASSPPASLTHLNAGQNGALGLFAFLSPLLLCLTEPGEYPGDYCYYFLFFSHLFYVLLYSRCFQAETRLAENNPLQHYYLSPAVRAATSFCVIVYGIAAATIQLITVEPLSVSGA